MKALTITYRGFHGTSRATLRIAPAGKPSPSQARKLNSLGCGMSDCTCGESALSVVASQDYRAYGAYEGWSLDGWCMAKEGPLEITGRYAS